MRLSLLLVNVKVLNFRKLNFLVFLETKTKIL